jgi:hypothetical protein
MGFLGLGGLSSGESEWTEMMVGAAGRAAGVLSGSLPCCRSSSLLSESTSMMIGLVVRR